jgi:hypothetical protein
MTTSYKTMMLLSFFLLLGSVPLQVLIGIEKIYKAVPIALLGVKLCEKL